MKKRLILRRPKEVREKEPGAVPFELIPLHGSFTLQHPKYVNVLWIKVTKYGASPYDWDDDSNWAKQRFDQKDMVYPHR